MIRLCIRMSAILAVLVLVVPRTAHAATVHTVCAHGCDYTSIQAAINASTPGDTVAVRHGTYRENLTIDRSLTLTGASGDDNEGNAVIQPALSGPNCTSGGSICAGGSNIILVQADNVTIQGLTLDGNNPTLTSGVVAGGVDIDARNGIITNHTVGTFNNLDVHDVLVRNVFLRGIYASSGGTFNFHDNVIENVQGNSSSIGMFNFGGSGTFANNRVSRANDAISSNHSSGTKFLDNRITKSGSGIHTDNAGDGGGTADLIQGNNVSDCTAGGYGIFVFVPYIAPTVQQNSVRTCSVGLAAFGGGAAATSPTLFKGNVADGSKEAGSIGALVTTDQLGYDCGSVNATFTGNAVRHYGTGFDLVQGPAFPGDTCASPSTQSVTAKINYNTVNENNTGLANASNNTIDATNNWWGCRKGPNMPGCDTITNSGTSATTYIPFLTRPIDGND